MKNFMRTMYAKVAAFLVFIDVTSVFLIITGYTTAKNVMASDTPERYIHNYNIYSLVMIIFMGSVFTAFGTAMLGSIRKGFKEVKSVTHALADGNTDIDIKYNKNDEFGDLLRDYRRLIDNTKSQAELAESVAGGNLTVQITPRSEQDVLGLA